MDFYTQTQAAQLLGWNITDIRKATTAGVTLPTSGDLVVLRTEEQRGGEKVIIESDLEDFIKLFESEQPGRHPPASVRRTLLVEANHKCGICSSDAPITFHHMIEWARLKHHDPSHMMAICAGCHSKIGAGIIDRLSQEEYKRRLKQRAFSVAPGTKSRNESLAERRKARLGPFLEPGDIVHSGEYVIEERLGKGGFATVWKVAACGEPGVKLALKVLHHQWLEDATKRERFDRGASQMSQLHHQNIVRVVAAPLEDLELGIYYFMMEHCDGPNLEDFVLKHSPTPEQLFALLAQVAQGLDYAHSRGVIHRDVKPANIIVVPTNLVECGHLAKLTDFDLVKANDTTGGTRTGAIGSFFFIAPELTTAAKDATSAADVYSLAMTFIFCFSGRILTMSDFRDPAQSVRKLRIPESIKHIIIRCLVEQPTDRPSASELAMALAASRAGSSIDLSEDPPEWANSDTLNSGCRTKHAAPYARLREGRDWPQIQADIDHLSTESIALALRSFFDNSLPFDSDKPIHISVQSFIADRATDSSSEQSDVHLIKTWLVQRRLALGVSEITSRLHQGDRDRLEAILLCFWNVVPPERRGEGFMRDEDYKKNVVSVRPVFSRIGLKPTDLAKGRDGVLSLGLLEGKWLSDFCSSGVGRQFSELQPQWWPK